MTRRAYLTRCKVPLRVTLRSAHTSWYLSFLSLVLCYVYYPFSVLLTMQLPYTPLTCYLLLLVLPPSLPLQSWPIYHYSYSLHLLPMYKPLQFKDSEENHQHLVALLNQPVSVSLLCPILNHHDQHARSLSLLSLISILDLICNSSLLYKGIIVPVMPPQLHCC